MCELLDALTKEYGDLIDKAVQLHPDDHTVMKAKRIYDGMRRDQLHCLVMIEGMEAELKVLAKG